ncbi:MAG: hypothetical protein K8R59_10770 [Thermoanaerobaculales bacterium]|nr:hypothetical protein [Thermoanaerobaculales bacterium]
MARFVSRIVILLVVVVFTGLASSVSAQEDEPRKVTSPFQEEYEIKVGEVLNLEVLLDGLLWRSFRIDAGDPVDFQAGNNVRTTITNELENLGEETLNLEVILLLEDERGRQLGRLVLRPIKAGGGRFKEDSQKYKIDGRVLAETAKVYFFAEVK